MQRSDLAPSTKRNHRLIGATSQTSLPSMTPPMDDYVDLCCSFGLPVWIASLLHVAKRLRSDCARRKKVYRLLHRKLMFHRVGVNEGNLFQPTYVYPEEVKMLVRSVFSQNILDYPDPCHDQVMHVTIEDLHKLEIN
ncbi:hypothetical protein D9C73_022221 [Collichthys lucidus]|uniref:Uncharacterized protein n=1 Tax=Collichthys lucidus TaxID=240159 RepID=A0A4U5VIE7_COLLU|nr:hypothetical protein D9C73_022221 [Collichthys lucidus]